MARIKLHVLASGSKGNAAIIENQETGQGVLVDCGVCKRDFFSRCEEADFDPRNLSGILITHEHTDHTKGLGVVLRGFAKADIPIPTLYVNNAVRDASCEIQAIQATCDIQPLREGDALSLAGLQVYSFPTSHDAAASFGFRFETTDDALGFMTDTGVVTGDAHEALNNCRILALEGNHDVRMLEEGFYPYLVKQRIASDLGHLSNSQSAAELETLLCNRLEHVVALHVSENNNSYQLSQDALFAVLARNNHHASVACGYQHILTSV